MSDIYIPIFVPSNSSSSNTPTLPEARLTLSQPNAALAVKGGTPVAPVKIIVSSPGGEPLYVDVGDIPAWLTVERGVEPSGELSLNLTPSTSPEWFGQSFSANLTLYTYASATSRTFTGYKTFPVTASWKGTLRFNSLSGGAAPEALNAINAQGRATSFVVPFYAEGLNPQADCSLAGCSVTLSSSDSGRWIATVIVDTVKEHIFYGSNSFGTVTMVPVGLTQGSVTIKGSDGATISLPVSHSVVPPVATFSYDVFGEPARRSMPVATSGQVLLQTTSLVQTFLTASSPGLQLTDGGQFFVKLLEAPAPWLTMYFTGGTLNGPMPDSWTYAGRRLESIVTVNNAALTLGVGEHVTTVRMRVLDNSGFEQDVPLVITLRISDAGVTPAPKSVALGGVDGKSRFTAPVAVPFDIANTSGSPLKWKIVSSPTWLRTNLSSGQGAMSVVVSADPDTAPDGESTGQLAFETVDLVPAVTSRIDVQLKFHRFGIVASSNQLLLTSAGNLSSLTRTLTIRNAQGGLEPFMATSDSPWLTVTASGVAGAPLVITGNTAGLALNALHEGTVTITRPGDPTQTDVIKVGMWVGVTAPTSGSRLLGFEGGSPLFDLRRPYVYYYSQSRGGIVQVNYYTGADTLLASFPFKYTRLSFDQFSDRLMLEDWDEVSSTATLFSINLANPQGRVQVGTSTGRGQSAYSFKPWRLFGRWVAGTDATRYSDAPYEPIPMTNYGLSGMNNFNASYWSGGNVEWLDLDENGKYRTFDGRRPSFLADGVVTPADSLVVSPNARDFLFGIHSWDWSQGSCRLGRLSSASESMFLGANMNPAAAGSDGRLYCLRWNNGSSARETAVFSASGSFLGNLPFSIVEMSPDGLLAIAAVQPFPNEYSLVDVNGPVLPVAASALVEKGLKRPQIHWR